jgi:predicted anti-sigma-YlaC factor YlaD
VDLYQMPDDLVARPPSGYGTLKSSREAVDVMVAGRWMRAVGGAVMVITLSGCSFISNKATKMVADTLSSPGTSMTSDNDPELVRDAVPFALKTYESLLESLPKYVPLLRATCSGFTSYAYGYLATDADAVRYTDRSAATAIEDRTLKMYMRAHGYCARALEERFKGATQALLVDPVPALSKAKKEDVELLYWSAASWGLAMALSPDTLAIDFPAVRALAERGLALDPSWWNGALHELMITLNSQELLGGSESEARRHFAAAVDLQKGLSPGPYISLAMGVSVARQDRAEFERLMQAALAVDPEANPTERLTTLLLQRRARILLDQADYLFLK